MEQTNGQDPNGPGDGEQDATQAAASQNTDKPSLPYYMFAPCPMKVQASNIIPLLYKKGVVAYKENAITVIILYYMARQDVNVIMKDLGFELLATNDKYLEQFDVLRAARPEGVIAKSNIPDNAAAWATPITENIDMDGVNDQLLEAYDMYVKAYLVDKTRKDLEFTRFLHRWEGKPHLDGDSTNVFGFNALYHEKVVTQLVDYLYLEAADIKAGSAGPNRITDQLLISLYKEACGIQFTNVLERYALRLVGPSPDRFLEAITMALNDVGVNKPPMQKQLKMADGRMRDISLRYEQACARDDSFDSRFRLKLLDRMKEQYAGHAYEQGYYNRFEYALKDMIPNTQKKGVNDVDSTK